MKNTKTKLSLTLSAALFVSVAFAFSDDPVSSYIFKGDIVSPWKASVGNGLNWSIPVENQPAATERKNLVIKPTDKDEPNDTLYLKWKGKKVKTQWGGNALYDTTFTISGHSIDLSTVKDVAQLVLQVKLKKKPNENVTIGMRCNYDNNCAGSFPIKAALRRLPKNEWTYLPIPLSCFANNGEFDFSNITTPLTIATQGKLEIEISNVGLAPLPEGSKGCS